MKAIKITGMKRTLKKIERFGKEEVENRVKRGLRDVGEFVKRESIRITPEETGNLRASAYGGHDQPVMGRGTGVMYTKVGYDSKKAPYAINVHEAPGVLKGLPRKSGKGTYWSPKGEPEFLFKAAMRNLGKMRRIMKRALKR